jgi:hypothetical protein
MVSGPGSGPTSGVAGGIEAIDELLMNAPATMKSTQEGF